MILRPGHGGKLFRLVRKGTRQSVEIGTRVVDRDGTEFEVVGGLAPYKPTRAGFVHLVRPGTTMVHQPYAPTFGFEWVEHSVERRKD